MTVTKVNLQFPFVRSFSNRRGGAYSSLLFVTLNSIQQNRDSNEIAYAEMARQPSSTQRAWEKNIINTQKKEPLHKKKVASDLAPILGQLDA